MDRIALSISGRTGIKFVRSSHLNVTLKEIDFEAMIAAAESKNAKKRWAKKRDAVDALKGDNETGLDTAEQEQEEGGIADGGGFSR